MAGKTKSKFRRSALLTDVENIRVREMLGRGCQGMATGVVELFMTHPPEHREWVKKFGGIMCLVKDIPKRSYFLRLYCLTMNTKVWEQEIVMNMMYAYPKPWLHIFEGEVGLVAVNYASDNEAELTYRIIAYKLGIEKSKWKHSSQGSYQGATSKPRTQMNTGRSAAEDEDDEEPGIEVHDSLMILKSKTSMRPSDSITILKTKTKSDEAGTKDGNEKSQGVNKSKGKEPSSNGKARSSLDKKSPKPDTQGPPILVTGGNVTAFTMEAAEDQAMGEFNMNDAVRRSEQVED